MAMPRKVQILDILINHTYVLFNEVNYKQVKIQINSGLSGNVLSTEW